MGPSERVGQRIRELRELRGWSLAELARRTGTTREAVSCDERGRPISTKRVLKYAQAFKVEPDLILEVIDEPELLARAEVVIQPQSRRVSARRRR
jgi:transcriptional regulator with XRE-family HTH domain